MPIVYMAFSNATAHLMNNDRINLFNKNDGPLPMAYDRSRILGLDYGMIESTDQILL